jgi:HD-GYP domain-containing protein (c-di-GMP phosphodiesterase class II)
MTFKWRARLRPIGREAALVPMRPAGLVIRVAGSGVVIVMLIGLAVGVSLWRSQTAARLATAAIADQKQLTVGTIGRDLLFDDSNIFAAYPRLTPAQRSLLASDQVSFTRAMRGAAKSADEHQRALLTRVLASDQQLLMHQREVELRLGGARGLAALQGFRRAEHTVDQGLDQFIQYSTRDAAAAQAKSLAAQHDARAVGLSVGIIAGLAALLLVAYVIWLLTRYSARVQTDAGLLEQRVREVEEARRETLQRLALAGEYRDDDTMHHTERVGVLAARIARRMGLPREAVEMIGLAAPMHDIGKVGVSDTILLKPGRLTPDERAAMQRHTVIGASILALSRSPVLQLAQEIALSHHERWDADGYPNGLGREAIPIAARIVAVADVYDALTHDRPYKHAWPPDQALAEIKRQAGSQFDPQVVAAFLSDQPHTEHAREHRVAARPRSPTLAQQAA